VTKLRRLVSGLKGCLSSLSPKQNHVLVLRTGLGLKHGYTRRQVAGILHVTLKREGLIERQATFALSQASAQGRCGNPLAAVRTAVLRTLTAVLAVTDRGFGSSGGASTAGAAGTGVAAHARRGSGKGASGSTSAGSSSSHPSGPASAAIAPPSEGGFNWLLLVLALMAALALAALWVMFSRLRGQPESAAGAHPRRLRAAGAALRARGRVLGTGFDPTRLRRAAGGLPAAVGLVALREAASTRRRNRRAAALDRRSAHRAALPAGPRTDANGHAGEDFAAAATAVSHDANGRPADEAPLEPSAADAGAPAGGVAAFELGGALAEKGDLASAEAAYRRADEQGHAAAASNLGVLLEHRGDFAGAEAAYRRADERNDATGAFNLASMLADRGDQLGAEEAYRRADQRGDGAAAFKLGTLMEERNDLFGAEAAFRRADERGHPSAPASLGMRLEHNNDLAGAEAAYRRADERGDATGAFKLGALLERRNDISGAEEAYARAAERGGDYVAELANAALTLLRTRH
jgi:tetratricopeptide (TPR) repeat protein